MALLRWLRQYGLTCLRYLLDNIRRSTHSPSTAIRRLQPHCIL
jgi:hypothetical protein